MADTELSGLSIEDNIGPDDLMYLTRDTTDTSYASKAKNVRGGAVSVKDYGATGDGVTDDTQAFSDAEAAVLAGSIGIIYVPPGTYIKGRTFPPAGCTYVFHPNSVMKQKAAASNIWRISNDHCTFYCNGALFDGSTVGASSHVFQIEDGDHCTLYDINISGSATAKDGLNITGTAPGSCQNARVIGGKIDGADRNCISIVAGTGVLIDGVECSNANTAPGAGIDVEANSYGMLAHITIQNCHVHDNGGLGIVNVFGDDVLITNCRVHDNGDDGIASSAGGAQFNSGVARPRDKRGISNFNTSTGDITASNVSATGVEGLEVGTVVAFVKTGAGAVPPELDAQSYWVVNHVNATGNTFRVGKALDFGEVASFTNGGAGTLDLDPDVSEVTVYCYCEGQASNVEISHNTVYGNAGEQIAVNLGVNTHIHHNKKVTPNAARIGISASFSRNTTLESNTVTYPRDNIYVVAGMNASTAVNLKSVNNSVINAGGNAFNWTNCSHMSVDGDYSYNGALNTTTVLKIIGCPYSRYKNITLKVEEHGTETYGIDADADTDNAIITGCDVMGVAASNANSLRVQGTGGVTADNILNDGTVT